MVAAIYSIILGVILAIAAQMGKNREEGSWQKAQGSIKKEV